MKKKKTRHPKKRFCIKCENEIKPIYPEAHRKPEQGIWNYGIVEKIYASYGSEFDTQIFIIAICDDCIRSNKKIIESAGNYM